MSNATFLDLAKIRKKRVLFEGSTAVRKGQALCYNADYGTATTETQSRLNRVEVASTTNRFWFAGTALYDYSAVTGGQEIVIAEPGGYGYMLAAVDCTIDSTELCFTVNSGLSGWFIKPGVVRGRGTARALKTTTSAVTYSDCSTSTTYTTASLTFSATGIDTGAAAGDSVVVWGGLAADASAGLTAGVYTVSSTGTGTLVVTAAAGSANMRVAGLSVLDASYEWAVPCYLYDGTETGGVQFFNGSAAGADTPAGGMCYVIGGSSSGSAGTMTLGAADHAGEIKGVTLLVASTATYVVTCNPTGLGFDGSLDQNTFTSETLAAASDGAAFMELLGKWVNLFEVGTAA